MYVVCWRKDVLVCLVPPGRCRLRLGSDDSAMSFEVIECQIKNLRGDNVWPPTVSIFCDWNGTDVTWRVVPSKLDGILSHNPERQRYRHLDEAGVKLQQQ